MKYLDETGLGIVWNKIKSNFVAKDGNADHIMLGDGSTVSLQGIKDSISAIPKFALLIVSQLPTENISNTTIYLVGPTTGEDGNVYKEYIYINGNWELFGTQSSEILKGFTAITSSELNTMLV